METSLETSRGVFVGKYTPPPPPRKVLSGDVIWGEKCKKGQQKKEENVKYKGKKTKDKGEIEV